jgi:cyclophilin family peptidyl-prolyl cis-trans isomerase
MIKEELTKLVIILIVIGGIGAGVYYFLNKTGQPMLIDNGGLSASPTITNSPTNNSSIKNNMHIITIQTNMGAIKFQTYDADAPKTVQNFITLANKGFYNNLIFHRVIKGFMIQGGDPNGNGAGGPGYQFEDELNPSTDSYKAGYKKGIVAMANAGPDTNGSQFFIMLEDYSLPNNYTIFGKVIEGQNVVDAIGAAKTDSNDKPLTPVAMESVAVQEVK